MGIEYYGLRCGLCGRECRRIGASCDWDTSLARCNRCQKELDQDPHFIPKTVWTRNSLNLIWFIVLWGLLLGSLQAGMWNHTPLVRDVPQLGP
jgi:hypothetical protein